MISICFVITGLYTGGAENALFKILQTIDRTKFKPFVVSLIDDGDFGGKFHDIDVPVFNIKMTPDLSGVYKFFSLIGVIRKINPDIVQTWMYHSDFLGGLAAKIIGGKKVIWGVRHSNLSLDKNKIRTLGVVKFCSYLSRFVPDLILCCSKNAVDVHVDYGYVSSKFRVIPNGFDLSKFNRSQTHRISFRQELSLDSDSFLVGMIARYDVQKNHIGFLEAIRHVINRKPDIVFVFAGTSVDHGNEVLSRKIDELGLAEHVRLLGRRDDVPRIMASLDVLASPSHGEGFSNVLGEAMACGVPCVVTNVGDSADIVGDTGVVVEPDDMKGLADGILHFYSMAFEERVKFGELARLRVSENYDIRGVTRRFEQLYFEVLESR